MARGRVRRAFERRSGLGWACSYVTSYRSGCHGDRWYRGGYGIEVGLLDHRACCVEAGPEKSSYTFTYHTKLEVDIIYTYVWLLTTTTHATR